ncbi:MAG: toll/interleukin-1 receptor domain-containing protein [Anaerolineales bacterium]
MPYIYIACAPEDKDTAHQLQQDLHTRNIEAWYDDGTADEPTLMSELEKSTHLVAILSPQLMLYPNALAAMEHARQQALNTLAMRIAPIEKMPPQLPGILPLDASNEAAYQDALETLLEDLAIEPAVPEPELPNDVLTALYSDDVEVRRNAIQALGAYRTAEPELREKAQEELNALVFREQNGSLRALVQAMAKSFDAGEQAPDPKLPSKEELAEQAKGRAVNIEQTRDIYLWQTTRWHVLLVALALVLSSAMVLIGSNPLYSVPLLLVGFVLPQFNIMIRQDGAYEWHMPGPLVGNLALAVLIVGLAGGLLVLLVESISPTLIGVEIILGAGYGLLVGWLSSLQFTVKLK